MSIALSVDPRRLMALLFGLSAFGTLIKFIQMILALNRTADWSAPAADILTTATALGVIFAGRRVRTQADS